MMKSIRFFYKKENLFWKKIKITYDKRGAGLPRIRFPKSQQPCLMISVFTTVCCKVAIIFLYTLETKIVFRNSICSEAICAKSQIKWERISMFELFLITLSNKFIGKGARINPELTAPWWLVRFTKHQMISNYNFNTFFLKLKKF